MVARDLHLYQARRHAIASSLGSSAGVSKSSQKQSWDLKAKQLFGSSTQSESAVEPAEADTASSSCVAQAGRSQECKLHAAFPRLIDPSTAAPQKKHLQLPNGGLTMAMTCCDMDDQTQDADFLPSIPCFNPASDFVFFSTVSDNCSSPLALAQGIQHDLSQTVLFKRSVSGDMGVRQSGELAPHDNSDVLTLSSCSSGAPGAPQDCTYELSTTTGSSCAPESPDQCVFLAQRPQLQPAPPCRKLPTDAFQSQDHTVACSDLGAQAHLMLDANPVTAARPTCLLRKLVKRHLAQQEGIQPAHTTTAPFPFEAGSFTQPPLSLPIASANALLHKLLLKQAV